MTLTDSSESSSSSSEIRTTLGRIVFESAALLVDRFRGLALDRFLSFLKAFNACLKSRLRHCCYRRRPQSLLRVLHLRMFNKVVFGFRMLGCSSYA